MLGGVLSILRRELCELLPLLDYVSYCVCDSPFNFSSSSVILECLDIFIDILIFELSLLQVYTLLFYL